MTESQGLQTNIKEILKRMAEDIVESKKQYKDEPETRAK